MLRFYKQPQQNLSTLSRPGLLPLLACVVLAGRLMCASDLPRHRVDCGKRAMEYLSFAPKGAGDQPLPALLLLHGAGDRAENFIRAWKSLAQEKKIILIAPELPREESFEPEAPKVFRCLVEDARKAINIDPHRIYLFGYSMGGYLAYDGALLDSGYFAAAAIHAMGIAEDYTWIVQRATRKIPIAISIGTKDRMVSLTQVRKTATLLRKSGFPVEYLEMPDHDHNYYDLSDVINGDAWRFMEGHRAP